MRRAITRLMVLVMALSLIGLAGTSSAARRLATGMTGAEEVPGPGDPNASGHAIIRLNQGTGTVCFDLSWSNIDGTVTAAHIHEAPAGVSGGVVVTLFTGASFSGTDATSGCTTGVDRALIKDIRQDPTAYYVNVHSTVFPGGAVRGQLGD